MEQQPDGELIKKNHYEGNDLVTEYTLEAGVYDVDIGLRSVTPHDQNWFHSGNEKDVREDNSLEFDIDNPLFVKIKAELASELLKTQSNRDFVLRVMEVVDRYVTSDMQEERVLRISDILKNKRGACASKSVLTSLLLKEIFPDMSVATVSGVVGKCAEKVAYPFDHMWLRVQKDDTVFVFDPMYGRYQIFRKFGNEFEAAESNFDFSNYTVDCFPLEGLSRRLNADAVGGVMFVKRYDGTDNRFMIESVNTLVTQTTGIIAVSVHTQGGSFRTVNGDVIYGSSSEGPKLKYPLLDLKKR